MDCLARATKPACLLAEPPHESEAGAQTRARKPQGYVLGVPGNAGALALCTRDIASEQLVPCSTSAQRVAVGSRRAVTHTQSPETPALHTHCTRPQTLARTLSIPSRPSSAFPLPRRTPSFSTAATTPTARQCQGRAPSVDSLAESPGKTEGRCCEGTQRLAAVAKKLGPRAGESATPADARLRSLLNEGKGRGRSREEGGGENESLTYTRGFSMGEGHEQEATGRGRRR